MNPGRPPERSVTQTVTASLCFCKNIQEDQSLLWNLSPRGVRHDFGSTQYVLDPCRWTRWRFPVLEAPTSGRTYSCNFRFTAISTNVLCINKWQENSCGWFSCQVNRVINHTVTIIIVNVQKHWPFKNPKWFNWGGEKKPQLSQFLF